MKSESRDVCLETLFQNLSVLSQSQVNLGRSWFWSHLEQKTKGLCLVLVLGINVLFYQLIFDNRSSLNISTDLTSLDHVVQKAF